MEMYANDLETFETNENYADQNIESSTIELPERPSIEMGMKIPSGTPMSTRRMLARYRGYGSPLLDHQGSTITIVGVVYHSDFVRDTDGRIIEDLDQETGEVIQKIGTRTIFRTEEHGLLTSTSPVVAKWAQDDLLAIFTEDGKMGDLMEPVRVKVEARKTKNNRRTYGFSFVD